MASRSPTVSVCIPTHNRAHFLGEAVKSVFAQTFGDFEIVVFDDASTDDTQPTLANLHDPRLRWFRHPRNVGISRNRNACLAEARGRYIAWLDSDDMYYPEMLATQLSLLKRWPNAGMAHAAYAVVDERGRRLADWARPLSEDRVEAGQATFRELVVANFVNGGTVLIRRECYDRVGLYAQRFRRSGEDWHMWLRVALHFDVAYSAAVLAKYRQHQGSASSASGVNGIRLRNDCRIISAIFSQYADMIPHVASIRCQAGAAIAAKSLLLAGEQFVSGRLPAAFRTTVRGLRACRQAGLRPDAWRLLLSIIRDDEYAHYRSTKAVLAFLAGLLKGTRCGQQVDSMSRTAPEWEEKQSAIAGIIRQVVPEGRRLAVVDKHDPTLLHLSRREGWHFPDRRLLPRGDPADGAEAIRHLDALRARGADFLVFTRATVWWLDHYREFGDYVRGCFPCLWSDADCMIFRLSDGSESCRMNFQAVSRMQPA